jgi:single-stranded DNA-binding protein
LVKDPTLDTTRGGKATCEFRVARSKGPDKPAVFMSCKAWEDLAEHIAENYKKGDMILVREATYETRVVPGEGKKTTEYPFFTVYEIGEDDGAVGNSDTGAGSPDDDVPY